jgi:hypothetical protein
VHREAAKIFIKASPSLLCDSLPISTEDIDKWLRDNGWERAKAKAVTRHRNAILKLLDPTPYRTLIYAHAKKYLESSVAHKVLDEEARERLLKALGVRKKLLRFIVWLSFYRFQMRWVSHLTYSDTCGELTEYLGSMARLGAAGPFPRRTLERRLPGSIRKNSQYSTEHHTIVLFEIDRASALFCSESIKTTILEADCPNRYVMRYCRITNARET